MIPVRTLRLHGASPFVLICDHASNTVPESLSNLGLTADELRAHIAWDIGAAGVTEELSGLLDAPAILCGTSRLVIDCNRQLDSPLLIPAASDGMLIPGNVALADSARKERIESWYQPYHDQIDYVLNERAMEDAETIVVAIHSMTPILAGQARPWQVALSSHVDRRFTDPVLALLQAPGDLIVGDNQPYSIETEIDYSIPFHALRRGLRHLQLELRQDEIADADGQQRWAVRLAEVFTQALDDVTTDCV